MPERLPSHPPRTRLPAGSCDCHMHAYGAPDRYPATAGSPFRPVPGGDIETYLRLRSLLGLQRAVVIQPSAYGTDHRCTLDSLEQLGDYRRAVVVVDETIEDAELERLTARGARELRIFMLPGGALGWEKLAPMAARVAPFNWHIQMQMDGRFLHERAEDLRRLPRPIVIDQNGKFLEPVSIDHTGFRELCYLLETGRAWVKTSRDLARGAPEYADVGLLARTLILRFPERALWATNCPHPSTPDDPPDDAHLIDLFATWCGSPKTMWRILVTNSATVYGFPDMA